MKHIKQISKHIKLNDRFLNKTLKIQIINKVEIKKKLKNLSKWALIWTKNQFKMALLISIKQPD